MKAYIVILASAGKALDIAHAVRALPGVEMADACWGSADVYAVVNVPDWKELNQMVLDKIHSMPGIIRTDTHVALAA
jgi:hypothetical protein